MTDTALINNLSDCCLKHIFSFLPILERLEIEKVCRRWRNIGEGGWNDIKELTIHEDLSQNLIYLILKRCGRYLKKLQVFHNKKHSHCLSMVIEFCRLDQLEEIELVNFHFKQRDVARNIRNLREIFEKSEMLVAVTLKGKLCTSILDDLDLLNPTTLRKLHLVNRSRDGLSINPDRFPNLKELYLNDVAIIENETIREEGSLKGLEVMDLGRCYIPENFIPRICTFTNLQKLGLRHYALNIKNEDIRLIAMHCLKIKEMTLRNFEEPTSDCFQYLGGMRSLEVLNFEEFLMDNTRNLAYLTNVEKLSFHACQAIVEEEGLIELIVNSSNLDELEFIEILILGRSFLDDIERIFKLGHRKKLLTVIVRGPSSYKHLSDLGNVTYHPLLDLRVHNDFDETNIEDDDYHYDTDDDEDDDEDEDDDDEENEDEDEDEDDSDDVS